MAKKMFFIIVSVLLMIGATVYMGINLQKGSAKSFSKSGYILNNATESGNEKEEDESAVKYYFGKDTAYKNSYDDNVEFKDTNGNKVKVPEASFLHYDDDSIGLLKKGVILNLADVKSSVPIYYNLFEGTVLQYNNGNYVVDNLGKQLKFKEFVVRVSDNKYLLVSDNIKLKLDGNTSTTIKSNYVEISIVEEGIIKIENQDSSYSTVATDASIGMSGNLSLNLDNGYFFVDEEPIVNLNSMIIDNDDNVDITPIEEVKDKIKKEKEEAEKEQQAQEGGNAAGGAGGGAVGGADEEGGGAVSGMVGTETEVVENALVLPTAQVSDVEISANSFQASITINDPDAIITGETYTTIVENSTNRVVFEKETDAGNYSIDVFSENLTPETSYSLVTNVHYLKNEIEYTMDVVQQLFVTSSIGISIEKDYYTATELSFYVKVDDYSKVKSADVKLLSTTGETLDTQSITDEAAKAEGGLKIGFSRLTANTKYTVVVDNILYEDAVVGDEYNLEISAKTLKTKPSMGSPTFAIDKKNSLFTLKLNNMVDANNGVEKYIYEVYDARTMASGAPPVTTIEKNTLSSIDLRIDDETIVRGVPYTYRVIALFYDNEKYIEYVTGYSNNMQMDGVESPTISWTTDNEKGGITFEQINGYITITDPRSTINYDEAITVVYTNSIGTNKSFTASGSTIIPFNVNNLRANETYTISVYATVDLMDGNPAVDAYHVGSVIVKTNPTKPIEVRFDVNTETVTDAFKVQCQLLNIKNADNTLEANTLSKLTFLLYDGPTNTGTVVKRITKVDKDVRAYYSQLKQDYYDQSFSITPSFFNMNNNELSSEYYTIQVVDAKDYTDFENDIPLVNSYVTVHVNGFIDDPDPDSKVWFTNTLIRNKDQEAGTYNHHDDKLDAETIVGIKVSANYDNTKRYGVSLTYHVWDYTDPENIYEVTKAQQTVEFKPDGSIDPVYYWFGYGTDKATDDKASGELRRGHIYVFSFVGKLDLNNDGQPETTYPSTETKRLKSTEFSIFKQNPNISMYPSKSTNDTFTIKYKLKDLDHALDDGMLTAYLKNESEKIMSNNSQKVSETDKYTDLTFVNLTNNNYLSVVANIATIKGKNTQQKTYINQYFDDLYKLPQIKYTLMTDVNRVVISINNSDTLEEAIKHIAALKLTFTCNGEEKVKDFVKLNGETAVVDMFDLVDFLGKQISLKVEAYYDTDLIGWDLESEYKSLQAIKDVYGGGEYYTINPINNFLAESNDARGSIFKVTKADGNYVLAQQGTEYTYNISDTPSDGGIKDNSVYMNLKQLDMQEFSTDNNKFSFNQIIPGISLQRDDGMPNISPSIQSVQFRAKVSGFSEGSIKENKIYVQISKTDPDGANLQKDGEPKEFTLDQINNGVCEIKGLQPKQDYAMEFYADISNGSGGFERKKLYDLDDNSDTKVYYFKTLSSVEISDINIVYTSNSYDDKNLLLTYTLDRILGYEKIEYKLYKQTEDGRFVDSGISITDDTGFKTEMTKNIPCPPGSGYDFGGVYRLTIIPYVQSTVGDEVEWIPLDEKYGDYTFNLRKLRNPYASVTATVNEKNNAEGNSLNFGVTLFDADHVIVQGQYTIQVDELNDAGEVSQTVTPQDYAGKSFPITTSRRSFIVNGLEEGKTYQFTVRYQLDIDNKGEGVEKEYIYKTKALNSDSISVGTVTAVANSLNRNRIDLNFINSYRITSIDSLRYSIYNSLDGTSFDNDVPFEVQQKTVSGTVIYTMQLQDVLKSQGLYVLQLQFISEDELVDEVTIDYTYLE